MRRWRSWHRQLPQRRKPERRQARYIRVPARSRPWSATWTFGRDGEWAKSRILQVQFRNVKTNDIGQFKDISTQVVVAPQNMTSGKLIYPYEKAK